MAWAAAIGMFTQAVNSVFGAEIQADAIRAQRDFQSWVNDFNYKLAEKKAQEVVRTGEGNVARFRGQVNRLVGKQRVSLAAQNLDLTFGVAADIQTDTLTTAEAEVTNIRNNAWRQAWGYKMEAINNSLQSTLNYNAANTQASNTLLTGYNNALSSAAQGLYYSGAFKE